MTAELVHKFGEVGSELERAVKREAESRAKTLVGTVVAEVAFQLEPIRRHQLTEKQIADDRHEFLCRELDGIKSMLNSLALKLGTNGSGGHHG